MKTRRSPELPLLRALFNDNAETFKKILEVQGWPSNPQWSDYKLLLTAIRKGCKRVARVLLNKGARVFQNRKRVNSPLHEAASRLGWTNFTKILLDRGAKVTDLNSKGDTALHIAFTHQKSMELIDLLLKAYLESNTNDIVNKDGLSILHIACTRPNLTFVKALIERVQVDVDLQVPVISSSVYAGYTPLHFAVMFKQYDVAELLLSHYNVDVCKRDVNESTPLHLATERGDIRMIDLIFRYYNNREDYSNRFGLSHFMAACAGSVECIAEEYLRVATYRSWMEPDTLVRSQVNTRIRSPNAGYTPLHFAAEYGRINVVKLLLRLAARCCLTTVTGNATPFALAYKREHVDVCHLLDQYCTANTILSAKRRPTVSSEQHMDYLELMNSYGCLRKRDVRSSSIDSDESTLTSSSLTETILDDPPTESAKHGQICEYDDANSVLDVDKDDNSLRLNNHMPENNDSNLYKSLEDSFRALTITSTRPLDNDLLSSLDNLDSSSNGIFDNHLIDNDVDESIELSFADQQLLFDDLFENFLNCTHSAGNEESIFNDLLKDNHLIDANDAEGVETSFIDDQMLFDNLFDKFLQDKELDGDEHNVFQSNLDNDTNSSTATTDSRSLLREIETTNQEVENTTTNADLLTSNNDVLYIRPDVTNSSSKSNVLLDKLNNSISSGKASTDQGILNGYETHFLIETDDTTVCTNREIYKMSARSTHEREVEVTFTKLVKYNN